MRPELSERLHEIREGCRAIRQILEREGATELLEFGDDAFWGTFDEIEVIAGAADAARAPWLAALTQIDDFGPMGRDLFLSMAALVALRAMPLAAGEAALALWREFPANASRSRKIGLCLVLEASRHPDAVSILGSFARDPDRMVSADAAACLQRLQAGVNLAE